MINFLKDVSVNTLIGELPSIIGFNNRSIEKEFNNIYDSSNNRIIKSVYVPTGTVKSHWGDFVNIKCEYLSVNNIDSLKTTFENISHNYFSDRIFNSSIDNLSETTTTIDYCHNPYAISSGLEDNHSLGHRLNNINSSIQYVYNSLSYLFPTPRPTLEPTTEDEGTTEENASNNDGDNTTSVDSPVLSLRLSSNPFVTAKKFNYTIDTDWINVKQGEPQGYSYDKTLVTNTNRVILKSVKTKQEYDDVIKGEINNYINVESANIKIKSDLTNILYAQQVGQVVNVMIDDNNLDKTFTIKINDNQYIKISNINDTLLFNLELIATQLNDDKMSYWSVYHYNVPANGTISIVKK